MQKTNLNHQKAKPSSPNLSSDENQPFTDDLHQNNVTEAKTINVESNDQVRLKSQRVINPKNERSGRYGLDELL